MKNNSAKKDFIKIFDKVSKYEGGAIYNHGVLSAVRSYTDFSDILYHIFTYAETRGPKVKKMINSTKGLILLKEAIEYAIWYDSLNDKKKSYIKENNRRNYFRSLKEGN